MKSRVETGLSMNKDNGSEMSLDENKESDSYDGTTPSYFPSGDFAFGDEFVYIAKEQLKRKADQKRRSRKEEAAKKAESMVAAIANEQFRVMYEAGGANEDYGAYDEGYDFGGEDDYDDVQIDPIENQNASCNDLDSIIASTEKTIFMGEQVAS